MRTTRPLRFSQLVAMAILPLVVGFLAGCAMNPGGDPPSGQALVDVTVAGDGTGTVEQDDNGSMVTLTATAADGSTFAGWSGAGVPNENPLTVNANDVGALTATFEVAGAGG